MKQMIVSKIPYGETFSVFGDTFVALDRVDSGVLAIRRDIWKKAAFDKDGSNDFRRASIISNNVGESPMSYAEWRAKTGEQVSG